MLYRLGPVVWENLTASYVESFETIEGNGFTKGGTADAHLIDLAIRMLQLALLYYMGRSGMYEDFNNVDLNYISNRNKPYAKSG